MLARLARALEALPAALEATLLPRDCSACGAALGRRHTFCATCDRVLDDASGWIHGVPLVCAGPYAPPLSTAIGRLKFQRRADLAAELARLLVVRSRTLELVRDDAWVPVPLHRGRLVERGFNQAALVARSLARATGSSFAPRVLERRRATEQQALLGRAARADNVRGAFVVRRPWTAGRVVLVDNVVTTGATLGACIEALRGAECEVHAVVALARAAG